MEIGSCVKCAETFSACGCGSKAAERYEAYEDPITDRQEYKIDELGGKSDGDMTRSEASDYIKKLQGRESGTWRAESGPLPADPRVSPLNTGLYSPSDTPEMAAEDKVKSGDIIEITNDMKWVDGKIPLLGRRYEVKEVNPKTYRNGTIMAYPLNYEYTDKKGKFFPTHPLYKPQADGSTWESSGLTHWGRTSIIPPNSYRIVESFGAENPPVPADPRVSPLNTGLYSPSDTPEMAAESEDDYSTSCECEEGEYCEDTCSVCVQCGIRTQTAHTPFADERFWPDEDKEERINAAKGKYTWYEDKGCDYCGEWVVLNRSLNLTDEPGVWNKATPFGDKIFVPRLKMKSFEKTFGAESKFDKLAKEIAEEYEEKGKSPKEAMEIGEATAAKIGRAKFGKRKFAKMGQKAESFGADESLDYPCDVCGKPSDYNFQDGTLRWKIKDDEFVVGKPKISVNGDQNDFYCKRHADMIETGIFYAESFGADESLDYPCDVCGKPSDYNFQDGTLRWKIKDDEFVVGKPKISVNGDQNDFYCKRHADMIETGIFYAEDDIDFDKSKADRNKDGRISDWERAVGNKVAKGIRESKRAEVGPHVPTRIAATTTPRGVVKTYTSIPAGDGHVIGQFTPDMDYAPSGMYGAESLTSSIEKGFGAVLGIMSGLIVGGFAMGAVSSLSKDDENRE